MNNVNYQTTPISDITLINAEYHNFSFKSHYHLDYHFGLITQGEQKFSYQGSKYITGPGQIQVMPPGMVHDGQTINKKGFISKIFSLSPQWLSRLSYELSGKAEFRFDHHCIENKELFYQLGYLHSLLNNSMHAQLTKECLSLDLFSKIIKQYGSAGVSNITNIGKKNISQLRDYLMANLDKKIKLKDLAQLCQLSESQLLRQFKRSTGMTRARS